MNVVLSCTSKFHTFDLARQMEKRGMLNCIFTGYPMYKLKNENLPKSKMRSLPWVAFSIHGLMRRARSQRLQWDISWFCNQAMDAYTATFLPKCDVFMAISANGLQTGRRAQRLGASYVCDRPCSHIRYQDQIVREEYALYGLPCQGVDPRVIAKEEAEYAVADIITVASTFCKRSFLELGVPESKIRLIPYGVDLSLFYPVDAPDPEEFQVLFVGGVSVRKGIRYLLESFSQLRHPRKHLTIVGMVSPEVRPLIDRASAEMPITCTGHISQTKLKAVMSRSHVMVLPSVEEGLATVQAQAMACGCPVIATTNTGSEDLYENEVEGFIVPIRDPEAIALRMQRLADEPALRQQMSQACIQRVKAMGGWDRYGDAMATLFSELVSTRASKSNSATCQV